MPSKKPSIETHSVPFLYTLRPGEPIALEFDRAVHAAPMKVRLLSAHCPADAKGTCAHLAVIRDGQPFTLLLAHPGHQSTLNIPLTCADGMVLRNVGDAPLTVNGVQKISLRPEILAKLESMPPGDKN